MTESNNQQPIPPRNYQPNVSDMQQVQRARSLITFANIAGPVSLLLGGMMLSGAGLICGFAAKHKIRVLAERNTEVAQDASSMKKTCRIALIVCGVAFAINAICAAFTVSAMLGMVESGKLAEIVESMGGTAASSTSIWG